MLYSIVGLLVIILDQAVKFWVSDTLFGTDVVRFIPGVVSLVNVHNDGAAFSFLSGSGARIYFIIATGVFVLLVIIALATNFIRGKFSRWCLVLVAAGGLGNMIDRIIYGYVQDMFKVEIFNFAIFNVADIFITVGAILFALAMIFERPESDLNDVLYEDNEDERAAKKKEKKERKARRKKGEPEETPAAETAAAVVAEPEEAPKREKKVRAARKSRQEKYEQEYEEYKAQQRAALAKKAAPAPETPAKAAEPKTAEPKTADGSDPFAAWERANARAEASEASSYAGRLMETPKPAAQSRTAVQPRTAASATAAPKAPAALVEKPQAAPAPAPKPAPKPASAEEEFSLDDILAEFK